MSNKKPHKKWRVSLTFQHPSGSIRNLDHIIEAETVHKLWKIIDGLVGDGKAIHTRVKQVNDDQSETLVATTRPRPDGGTLALPPPDKSVARRVPKLGAGADKTDSGAEQRDRPKEFCWYKHEAFEDAPSALTAKSL